MSAAAAAAAAAASTSATSATAAPALVDALCEFLEAAVHVSLRARGPYAPELFERRRLYGVSVARARHPELCAYIASAVGAARPLIASGALQELAVAFSSADGAPLSKVSFVLHGVAPSLADADAGALEAALRSALLKLQFIDGLLAPLPPGASCLVCCVCLCCVVLLTL